MSLEVAGVWQVGVWATTVWGEGVWREGAPIDIDITVKPQNINTSGIKQIGITSAGARDNTTIRIGTRSAGVSRIFPK